MSGNLNYINYEIILAFYFHFYFIFVSLEVAEFCLFNEDFRRKYMWSCGILSVL